MKHKLKNIKKVPLINAAAARILTYLNFFPGTKKYWEKRYAKGGNSGVSSYGKCAKFKAKVMNSFVKDNEVKSVLDFGCGDGNQLSLFNFPSYVGLDVSKTAIRLCIDRFKNDKTKSFFLYDPEFFKDSGCIFKSDLTLSMDVLFHLVEDHLFELYMKHLFLSSDRFVVIYSDDINSSQRYHVKSRNFSKWVGFHYPKYKLINKIRNIYSHERSDFFIYKKGSDESL